MTRGVTARDAMNGNRRYSQFYREPDEVARRSLIASTTRRLSASRTNHQWNADGHRNRTCEHPQRQNEVQHRTDCKNSDEPRKSVTHPETPLHDAVIDRPSRGT
jgi:hypothetical protein